MVVHAANIIIHLLCALLVQILQKAKDATGDITTLIEAIFRVLILLLALQKLQILGVAPYPNVLRRRHQHRRRWDRVS